MFGISKLYLNLISGAIVLILIGLTVYRINKWDSGRLAAAHEAGVQQERSTWTTAQQAADAMQAEKLASDTKASETASDAARAGAQADKTAQQAGTRHTVETIAHEHKTHPVVCPDPDAALPAGVLDALDQARGRALEAAAPATG